MFSFSSSFKLQNKPPLIKQQESNDGCEGKGSSILFLNFISGRIESHIVSNFEGPQTFDQNPSVHSSLDHVSEKAETKYEGLTPSNSNLSQTLGKTQSSYQYEVFAPSVLNQSNTLVKIKGENRSKGKTSETLEQPSSSGVTKTPYVSDFLDPTHADLKTPVYADVSTTPSYVDLTAPAFVDLTAPAYVDLTTSEIVPQTQTGGFSEVKVPKIQGKCSSCAGEIYLVKVLSQSKTLCIDCGYKQEVVSRSLYNRLKCQEMKFSSDSCQIRTTSSGVANVQGKTRTLK